MSGSRKERFERALDTFKSEFQEHLTAQALEIMEDIKTLRPHTPPDFEHLSTAELEQQQEKDSERLEAAKTKTRKLNAAEPVFIEMLEEAMTISQYIRDRGELQKALVVDDAMQKQADRLLAVLTLLSKAYGDQSPLGYRDTRKNELIRKSVAMFTQEVAAIFELPPPARALS